MFISLLFLMLVYFLDLFRIMFLSPSLPLFNTEPWPTRLQMLFISLAIQENRSKLMSSMVYFVLFVQFFTSNLSLIVSFIGLILMGSTPGNIYCCV